MKRAMLIAVMCAFLASCAGLGDWSYKLPNGYEVQHINSDRILITYARSEIDAEGIPSFIKEFSYDDRYVFSKNSEDIKGNKVRDEVYYALDTIERRVYGPFNNIEELTEKADEWNVELPSEWYSTSSDPSNINNKDK